MMWLTWRQHRAEAIILGVLVAATGVTLLALGLPMHSLFPEGAARCAGLQPGVADACSTAVSRLWEEHGYASKMLSLFNLLPFVIGAFLGAPLLARELESGTWQLAWTQAVPRMRWLAVKVAVLAALTGALAVVLTTFITWYRQPLDALDGRFAADAFDLEGLAPAAYALFAFAAATCAGTLLRRSLPALATALAAYIAVRFVVAGWLRPHYQTPRILTEGVAAGDPTIDVAGRMQTGDHLDWILATGYADSAERHLTLPEVYEMDVAARRDGVDLSAYMHDQGVQQWVEYHPADRFWTFQIIEAAIFVTLAAALLILVALRIKRRTF
ncbi:ABC transporter permease subunit [Micromonospora sp. KC213]|uniref:ABC transporter permease subunit n=1 Tax=Micromonospora sp. KC213 TaxID=2530378 RepID=UPI00104F66F0|nr:ABC transporter permease subunit [Micromonospora sp. KC213]TDC40763.1 transporter [Micromonospora sp. KC213]